jgi:hypothetical protein
LTLSTFNVEVLKVQKELKSHAQLHLSSLGAIEPFPWRADRAFSWL